MTSRYHDCTLVSSPESGPTTPHNHREGLSAASCCCFCRALLVAVCSLVTVQKLGGYRTETRAGLYSTSLAATTLPISWQQQRLTGLDHSLSSPAPLNVTHQAKLKELAPDGVDCFFDNTAGPVLEEVLLAFNNNGRIAQCGLIHQCVQAPTLHVPQSVPDAAPLHAAERTAVCLRHRLSLTSIDAPRLYARDRTLPSSTVSAALTLYEGGVDTLPTRTSVDGLGCMLPPMTREGGGGGLTRVSGCGGRYNTEKVGVKNYDMILMRRLTVQGFICIDQGEHMPAMLEMVGQVRILFPQGLPLLRSVPIAGAECIKHRRLRAPHLSPRVFSTVLTHKLSPGSASMRALGQGVDTRSLTVADWRKGGVAHRASRTARSSTSWTCRRGWTGTSTW
jgi:hypothetical protein